MCVIVPASFWRVRLSVYKVTISMMFMPMGFVEEQDSYNACWLAEGLLFLQHHDVWI